MPATIVENSNFFINAYKNSHFAELYLIDVTITNIVSIVCSWNLALVVYV